MERETLEVDVLVLGAGAAGLSCAIDLARREKAASRETTILVLEKGEDIGNHQLSGAVMDPRGIRELFPDFEALGFPIEAKVEEDRFALLTSGSSYSLKEPWLPKPLKNNGNFIVSAFKISRWLKEQAEKLGIEVYPGFAAAGILYDEQERIVGVRTVDQGLDKKGEKKSSFQPGMDIKAKVTVFAEGTRGSLAKQLVQKKKLDQGRNPQIYATGLKEIWETKQDLKGKVIHTLGWPLDSKKYGGGWIYGLPGNRVSIGFVVGLDYGDPSFDPHEAFQKWKTHPLVKNILDGGTIQRYGAKTIPEGGYFSMPQFFGDGFVMVGDSAGFLNAQRLKGIHLAIKSGMLAAEAISAALAASDFSSQKLSAYAGLFETSWAKAELYAVRNFRQAFQGGLFTGFFRTGLQMIFGGRDWSARIPMRIDSDHYFKKTGHHDRAKGPFDKTTTFDKLTDVFHSGTIHEEDQPCHLVVLDSKICATRCKEEYGNPCQHFCPAQVYEWRGDRLEINASNCVHCKTCDIADPYQIINWVVPEGGGGPKYVDM